MDRGKDEEMQRLRGSGEKIIRVLPRMRGADGGREMIGFIIGFLAGSVFGVLLAAVIMINRED